MIILGIETTCDETGVGIVEDGRNVLSNVVSSSLALHKKFGGIVPEVAAREQVKLIVPVLDEALYNARCGLADIDTIAVAYGPGLIGSLLIGVEAAKSLALALDKPLFAVNHLMGHVYANWIEKEVSKVSKVSEESNKDPGFPLVALVVSGGHTDLLLISDHGKCKWLGGTRDDAAGEVFDKVARVLGLGYPGGPAIEKVAFHFVQGKLLSTHQNKISNIKLPRPMISEDNFDFSFAGLKTAVVNLVHSSKFTVHSKEEIAYEFQNAIVEVLVTKVIKAAKKYGAKSIVVGGGVAANENLRTRLAIRGSQLGIPCFFPSKKLSVDNGVMIAAAAFFEKNIAFPLKLQANPSLHF